MARERGHVRSFHGHGLQTSSWFSGTDGSFR